MHLGPDIWVGIAAAGVAAVGVWYARLQARVARQAEEAAQAEHNKLLIRGVDTVNKLLLEMHESRSAARHMVENRDPSDSSPIMSHPLVAQANAAEIAYADALESLRIDVLSQRCPQFVRGKFIEAEDALTDWRAPVPRTRAIDDKLLYQSREAFSDMRFALTKLSDPNVDDRDKRYYAISGRPHPKDPWRLRLRLAWYRSPLCRFYHQHVDRHGT
jgi:hypothetical protein